MQDKKSKDALQLDTGSIYEVFSDTDATVVLAIEPSLLIDKERSYISWYDTVKERVFEIQDIHRNERYTFTFVSKQNQTYRLRKLTLESFHDNVIPLLSWKEEANMITSEEEMVRMLRTSMEFD